MKILFLQKRILFPVDCGWKIRTLNVLKHLARRHEITYMCNVQAQDEPYLAEMRSIGLQLKTLPWKETPRESLGFYGDLAWNLLSPRPFTADKDYDPALRQLVRRLLAEDDYDLLVCDFVQMARNVAGLEKPASVLFQHNVEARIFQRYADSDAGLLRRQYMRLQYHKMRRFESESGRGFDSVVAVSREDRRMFEQDYGWTHVHVIDTAVDLEYFCPQPGREVPGRVVFVGSMDWIPNQDGVARFAERIWPIILRQRPGAVFQIVGRNPSAAVQRLGRLPGIQVNGSVPDVRPHLAEAEVVVVPLWVGGGTRLKFFEAFAMEKAVVSTSLGAEGLDVEPGRHFHLADTEDEFARRVVELMKNSELRSRLSAAARRLVVENYSAERVAGQFETICRQAVETRNKVNPPPVNPPSPAATEIAVPGEGRVV